MYDWFIKRLFTVKDKKRNERNCTNNDFIYLKIKRKKYFGLAGLDFYYLKVRNIDFSSLLHSSNALNSFSSSGEFYNNEMGWYVFFDLNLSVTLIGESDFNKAKIKYIGDV